MVARSPVLRSGDDAESPVSCSLLMPKVWFGVTEATKWDLGPHWSNSQIDVDVDAKLVSFIASNFDLTKMNSCGPATPSIAVSTKPQK